MDTNEPFAPLTATIPPQLLAQLEKLRPILEQQGVVQQHHGSRRGLTYRLRYRADDEDGIQRHRSLELGRDAGLADQVEALIRSWRKPEPKGEEKPKKEVKKEKAAKTPEELEEDAWQDALNLVLKNRQCGNRTRKRAHAKLAEARKEGMSGLFGFVANDSWLKTKAAGRPRKRRLW